MFFAVTLSTMAINAQMPMLGYFYTRFFGMKAYGEIAGINMAVLSLIMGFSAPLVGILYDRTGSYDLALLGMIVGGILCALLYMASAVIATRPISKPWLRRRRQRSQFRLNRISIRGAP